MPAGYIAIFANSAKVIVICELCVLCERMYCFLRAPRELNLEYSGN
jgi:hypothetical protein